MVLKKYAGMLFIFTNALSITGVATRRGLASLRRPMIDTQKVHSSDEQKPNKKSMKSFGESCKHLASVVQMITNSYHQMNQR